MSSCGCFCEQKQKQEQEGSKSGPTGLETRLLLFSLRFLDVLTVYPKKKKKSMGNSLLCYVYQEARVTKGLFMLRKVCELPKRVTGTTFRQLLSKFWSKKGLNLR